MKNKFTLKDSILCALFAAVCCIFSIITIPTGIIPVSLGVLGVILVPMILGTKRGLVSVVIFLILGAVGLPVFSSMQGGISVIVGPTGGYITSYIFVALIVGLFTRNLDTTLKSRAIGFVGCIIAIIVCYVLGTVQFMFVTKTPIWASLTTCVIPFIPFDVLKAILALLIAPRLKKAVDKN